MKAAIIMMMFCFMAWVSVGADDDSIDEKYWENQIEVMKDQKRQIETQEAEFNQQNQNLDQEKANASSEIQKIEKDKQKTIEKIKDLNVQKQEDTKHEIKEKEQYQQSFRNSYSRMGSKYVFEKQILSRKIDDIEKEIQKTTKKYDTQIEDQKQIISNLNQAKADISQNIKIQIQNLNNQRFKLDNEKKQFEKNIFEMYQNFLDEEKLKTDNIDLEASVGHVDSNRMLENANQYLSEQKKMTIEKINKMVREIEDVKILQKAKLDRQKKLLDKKKANEYQKIEEEKKKFIDKIKKLEVKKEKYKKDAKAEKDKFLQRLRNVPLGRHAFEKQILWREIELIEEKTKQFDEPIKIQEQKVSNLNREQSKNDQKIEKQKQSLDDQNEKKECEKNIFEMYQKFLDEINNIDPEPSVGHVDSNRMLENGNQLVSEQKKMNIEKINKMVQELEDVKRLQKFETDFSSVHSDLIL